MSVRFAGKFGFGWSFGMWQMKLVGVLYCISGAWCVYRPDLASTFLGFSLASEAALVEFLAVYGGIQLGLGLGALSASFSRELIKGSLWVLISISFGLLLFRFVSMLRYNAYAPELLVMLVLELVILLVLLHSYRHSGNTGAV